MLVYEHHCSTTISTHNAGQHRLWYRTTAVSNRLCSSDFRSMTNENILDRCLRFRTSYRGHRISPLAQHYDCLRQSLLIIALQVSLLIHEPSSVVPCWKFLVRVTRLTLSITQMIVVTKCVVERYYTFLRSTSLCSAISLKERSPSEVSFLTATML